MGDADSRAFPGERRDARDARADARRSMTHHYSVSGALLVSEVALPSLGAECGPSLFAAHPSISFCVLAASPIESTLRGRSLQGDPYVEVRAEDDTFVLRAVGHADFTFDGAGRAITCAPLVSCAPSTIEQLLLDQVLPKVLSLHGKTCLHASSVVVDHRLVAFLGPSGCGKSTLAASFATQDGAPFGDDCLALDVDEASPRVIAHASYASVRLCRDAAAALENTFVEVSPRTPWKVRVPVGASVRLPRPLDAAYVLEEATGSPRVERLTGHAAFQAFASYMHRLDPECRAALARELPIVRALAERVPVFRLAYARRFADLDSVRAAVRAAGGRP